METEKTLIFTDRAGQQRLQKDIIEVQARCNNLIQVFEASQPFVKITTPDVWLELVKDPAGMYDRCITQHTEIKSTGNLRPDPGVIATLFNLDRDNYLNITSGKPIKETCLPCKSVKVIRGQRAISLQEFREYERFLLFQNGTFELFNSAIEVEKEKYKLYIENEAQQDVMSHWSDLCRLLNEHHSRGYLKRMDLQQVSQLCGLRFVPDLGEAFLNDDTVKNEILKTNKL